MHFAIIPAPCRTYVMIVIFSKLYQKLQNISGQIFPVLIYILTKFDPL